MDVKIRMHSCSTYLKKTSKSTHTRSQQISFQGVDHLVIQKLTNPTPNHICHQLKITYHLTLQSTQVPSIKIDCLYKCTSITSISLIICRSGSTSTGRSVYFINHCSWIKVPAFEL